MQKFDIDIDVNSSVDRKKYGTRVSIYNEKKKKLMPHPSGVILDGCVPIDKVSKLTAIDHARLSDYDLKKVDLLSNHSYNVFRRKEEIYDYLDKLDQIDWRKLREKEFCESLPHLSGNFHYVDFVQPSSIIELADVLALMRPGKMHLLEAYKHDKNKTRKELYKRPTNDKMYMKKSHAVAYATMIGVLILKSQKQKSSLFFD